MAAAPIHRVLTGLAVTDLLLTMEYVPFTCYMYVALPPRQDFSYPWAMYMLFHASFTQVLHTISICITLTLAVWRYLAIRFPERMRALCTKRASHRAIGASYALALLLCAPNYVASEIRETCVPEMQSRGSQVVFVFAYHVGPSHKLLHRINFWVYSVLIKLLPCVALTFLSCRLIRALYEVDQRRCALKGEGQGRGRRPDRTTRMLVAVLVLFLVTEIPQGVLGLLSGLFGGCFFTRCYHSFGEMMDALALLNGAINFILYCSMSRQFRTTFSQLFRPRALSKWSNVSQATEMNSTYV